MSRLVIATRGSMLALWQAEHIKSRLQRQHPGLEVELLKIKTSGDKIQDVPLAKIGGKGLFVKEIEEALLDGRADLAVHSMKDVPAELPDGLTMGVIPEREDPTDTLLSVEYDSLDDLPDKALVGTSSLRRQTQLLLLRPDLEILSLRGNVDTRLRKLMNGDFDAVIMATAGLKRLELTAPKHEKLGPPRFLPAVGQGALGIEYRKDRPETAKMLQFLNHEPTSICVTAERGFLLTLEGGCQVPIAGHAEMLDNNTVALTGLVSDLKAERVVRKDTAGPKETAFELGRDLALRILADGGKEILTEVYGAPPTSA